MPGPSVKFHEKVPGSWKADGRGSWHQVAGALKFKEKELQTLQTQN